jgi:hypothetical protein
VVPTGGRSGCSKPLIIGCVVIFLLGAVGVIGGLVYLARNATSLLQWSFRQIETSVTAQLPPDVTPAERERLRQAFADANVAIQGIQGDPVKAQRVQAELMELARTSRNSTLTRDDVRKITESLERLAGKEPREPEAEQTPSPPG